MSDYPRAVVREVDGQLVLDDPDALAMIRAVEKHNTLILYEANRERIEHFKNRIVELGRSPKDLAIVIINVDDPNGGPIADALMPGVNWDDARARGEVPLARGLAGREGMQGVVDLLDKEAGDKLRSTKTAVIVVDRGVVEIYEEGA
jgi:hypothetical protein